MKVINCAFLTHDKRPNPFNAKLPRINYSLFSCLTLLLFLLPNMNVHAQQDTKGTYMAINKVAKQNRLHFKIGEAIKYKLNTSKKEKWRTKIITGFSAEENLLILGDEKLPISSIDRVHVIGESEFGKALNKIILGSVGLIGASNLAWRIDPRTSYRAYRIRNFAVVGGAITAITAGMVKLATIRYVYKLGKNHELHIVQPE